MGSNEIIFDLESILKKNQKVYLYMNECDISLLKTITQVNSNFMMNYPGSFCVFQFDIDSKDHTMKSAIDMLISRNFLNLIAGNNYAEAFSSIASTGKRKIFLAVRNMNQRNEIIAAGKSAGIYVEFCKINDDGSMGNCASQRPENRDLRGLQRNNDNNNRRNPANTSRKREEKPYVIKKSPEQIGISKIIVSRNVYSGDLIYDSTGTSYLLGEKVLTNNGASTYKTNANGIWVKLYDANNLNTFIESKINRMLRNPLKCQGVCWPLGVANDDQGKFRGYFFNEVKGEPLHLSVLKKAGIEKYFPNWTKIDLCVLTLTILDKIDYLHRNGILMGCINPAAIRVCDENTVFFTDTDNYQVEGYPSFVYNISFTPPELLGKKIYLTDMDSENFSVAELVFMIMMTGKTPYAVGINGNPEAEIKKMNFPYSNRKIHGNAALPSMWRFMWSHLTPFKEPFYETFQKNGKYNSQGTRRNTGFWIKLTKDFKTDLQKPVDRESLKLYPRTFKRGKNDEFYRCRYCGVEHPRFYFSNQFFDDYQICNGCIGKQSDVCFTCVDCGKTYYYTNRTALFHKQKKEQDADWKEQKHCRDCKMKTMTCSRCGKEYPYYQLINGLCPDCSSNYRNQVYTRIQCRNCGRMFDFTYGDRAFYAKKGYSLPTKCPDCRKNGNTGGYNSGRKNNSSYGSKNSSHNIWEKLFGN